MLFSFLYRSYWGAGAIFDIEKDIQKLRRSVDADAKEFQKAFKISASRIELVQKRKARTLTLAQKRKLKEKYKFKCQNCKGKFPDYQLVVHHIVPIAKSKASSRKTIFDITILGASKKTKPSYDRSSNLIVLCRNCHAAVHAEVKKFKAKLKKIKKAETKKSKSAGKSRRKKTTKNKKPRKKKPKSIWDW